MGVQNVLIREHNTIGDAFNPIFTKIPLTSLKNVAVFYLSAINTQKKKKKACQTHASYNSDPGHRYKLRVIQVNRLTQVFNSQRSGQQNRTATPAIVLKIV